jgi:hypothetical protein
VEQIKNGVATRAEIGDIRLNSGSETQIGLAGKRGLLVV